METAKVDIRKLQLLNDRVSQCIDALNQVRLTVHGLSHSSAIGIGGVGGIGAESSPMSFPQTLSQDPRFAPNAQWGAGLSHSTPGYGPMGAGLAQGTGQPFFGQIPGQFAGQTPGQIPGPFGFGQQALGGPYGGLSHSNLDFESYNRPTWADPFLAARVAQTFPYARFAAPPVVAIY